MKRKRILAGLLALTMCATTALSAVTAFAADTSEDNSSVTQIETAVAAEAEAEPSVFQQELESLYIDPDRVYSTDVRWWLGTSSSTTDTLREEIQALYDGGFRGVELCMQNALGGAPNDVYAYGSEQWSYKWKFMMNELLDLGMGVYLTSGTHWSTSNVPGLDPDSQAAMQNVTMATTTLSGGETLTQLPTPGRQRDMAGYIGAYALRQSSESGSGNNLSYVIDYDTVIDLSEAATITQGDTVWEQALNWTAPGEEDATWRVFAYWTQGTYQTSSPSVNTSYATNYFDERGVEALREFWEANYLDDPELNQKIMEGDVQLFMDSLEITQGTLNQGEITFWAEDFAEEFVARKGYDIRPYLFLTHGLINGFNLVSTPYYETKGTHDLTDNALLREKIINDYQGFLTEMYMERMLLPLKEWLNSVGIKTRAQITYGRPLEISEPIMAVDYPEAESFNQYHQVDIYRLWTGGSKLQNKVLSQEGGTQIGLHGATSQMHLRDAYSHYAAGFQRQIWHIWGSVYSYNESQPWAGDTAGGTGFYRFSWREPNSRDYDELNGHLGRVQQLVQTGRSRTDVGFIHNNWFQGIRFGGGIGDNIEAMNWQFAHQGIYYRSTELQDNGYTYDYFSPKFLFADDVYFDEDTLTIEQAGYKAIVLYQRWLDIDAAEKILELAQKGLKVVILDGAATGTTFNDGRDADLAAIIDQLKALPTVRTAEIYDADEDFDYFSPVAGGYSDGVLEALQDLGVRPYAGFAEENHQLLTQTRTDEDGNLYLYAYNYCPNDYHHNSHKESVRDEDHGINIQTEIKMDGLFIPYAIDAWSGQVTELGHYRYEDGQTVFSVDLDYGNIALYAFEAIEEDDVKLHIVSTDAESAYVAGDSLIVRTTKTGLYDAVLSNGGSYASFIEVPAAYDITGWDVTIESWNASATTGDLVRTEELLGVTTNNYRTSTVVTPINVTLDTLTTWNNIPEVGQDISGLGHYEATFDWDAGKADGAYLNFGETLDESMKVWINGTKVGGDVSTNPTKVKKSVSGTIDGEPAEGKDLYSGGINWTKPIVDISAYLVDGENKIVIAYSSSLTNRQLQRGYISRAINSRSWWGNHIDYRAYGPGQAVIIPFVEEKVTANRSSDGFKLSTDAFHVKQSEYANITTEFDQAIDSNTAILNYYFDTELFQFADFHYADGVTKVSHEATDYGAKVVVMIPNYSTQTYGRLAIQAKPDAPLTNGWAVVKAEAEYVVRGEDGEKEIRTTTASTAFTTLGNGPDPWDGMEGDTNNDGVVDLIDLSNMIDWFGITSSDSQWKTLYTFFDFNNNGEIDIFDISRVAQLIK